jgi:hypothetical protein
MVIWPVTCEAAFQDSFNMYMARDPEARVRFPALPEKQVVGLKRNPLSLVSTTEELLDRNIAAPV